MAEYLLLGLLITKVSLVSKLDLFPGLKGLEVKDSFWNSLKKASRLPFETINKLLIFKIIF